MVMVYGSAAAGQLSFPLELWMAATGWKPGKYLATFVKKVSWSTMMVWWVVREEMGEVKI